jgi:16S rRNA (uracil1498-N3)-methyltransferase
LLFDGSGREFPAVIDRVGHGEVRLTILDRQEVDRELPIRLMLAVALPKGDRQKWLVEKAVELGVQRLIPLKTERSVAQPVAQALARLQRSVIEASKQCGRNRLMQIAQPQNWPDLVATTRDIPTRILAHPEGQARATERGHQPQAPLAAALSDPVLLAVGPEGGFSAEEIALAVDAGWRVVDLGPRILRVETAAIVLAAMVAQH